MESILALLIPVLAMATGCIAVARMPREAFLDKQKRNALPAADNAALLEEVAMLREEMAQLRERVDFTERLLMDAPAAPPRLSAQSPLVRSMSA